MMNIGKLQKKKEKKEKGNLKIQHSYILQTIKIIERVNNSCLKGQKNRCIF